MAPTYVVVSILEPHGGAIDRRSWPLHLTLLPEFRVVSSETDVAERVQSVAEQTGDFDVLGMHAANFGSAEDVPGRLVSSSSVIALHGRLLTELGDAIELVLPGFCGDGFQPHVTDQPHLRVDEGQLVPVDSVALVRLEGDRADVVAAFPLSGREHELGEAWRLHASTVSEWPAWMPRPEPDPMPIVDENGLVVAWVGSGDPVEVDEEFDVDEGDYVYEPLPPMPVDEPGPSYSLTIRMGDWHIIDGTMDNRSSNDVTDYGLEGIARPNRIRRAGWDAAPEGWPADDETITVILREPDRAYILDELRKGLEIVRFVEDQDDEPLEFPDEPDLIQHAIDAVREAWPESPET